MLAKWNWHASAKYIHTLNTYPMSKCQPTNQHECERNISWAANSFSTFDTNVRLQQTYHHCLTLFASKYRCERDSSSFFSCSCYSLFQFLSLALCRSCLPKRTLFNQKTFDNYTISQSSVAKIWILPGHAWTVIESTIHTGCRQPHRYTKKNKPM